MERSSKRNRNRRPKLMGGGKRLRSSGSSRRRLLTRGNGHRVRRGAVPAHPAPNAAAKLRSDPRYTAAVRNFEAATRYFLKEQYGKAREVFEKVASEAPVEIAERARVHLRLCEQKLTESVAAPRSATDNYNLGVAALNARRLDQAIEYLRKADRSAPNREEIRYALAAAFALQGNPDAALEHLKASIELRPGNRFQARLDEDFQSLSEDHRFRKLMQPEPPSATPSPY
jgi:tetratricopeptide (TPR) repeat protein